MPGKVDVGIDRKLGYTGKNTAKTFFHNDETKTILFNTPYLNLKISTRETL